MKVELLYGRKGLVVNVPDGIDATVIRKHDMAPLTNPSQAVQEALGTPVACSPLFDLARGKNTACILICDITRPVPNGTLLPP